MDQRHNAKLRVCASCEFIFRSPPHHPDRCPMCGFGSYGARYVYGNKCYRHEKTQQPWIDKKVAKFVEELHKQIGSSK